MKLDETMLQHMGCDVYVAGDDDQSSAFARIAFVNPNSTFTIDLDASQMQRLADVLMEKRREMFNAATAIKCPACGYTEHDAIFHGDHDICRRYPFFPDECPREIGCSHDGD